MMPPQIRSTFNQSKPERIIIAGDGTIKLAADALENEEVIFVFYQLDQQWLG
jgi:predicted phosphodiesterase